MPLNQKQNNMEFYDSINEPNWWLTPSGNFHHFKIGMPSAPNRFHRWMQYLLLGFKWKRGSNDNKV